MQEEKFERPLLLRHMGDMVDGDWLWGQLYNDNYRNYVVLTFFSREIQTDEIHLSMDSEIDIEILRETFASFTNIAYAKNIKRINKSVKMVSKSKVVQDKILEFLITR